MFIIKFILVSYEVVRNGKLLMNFVKNLNNHYVKSNRSNVYLCKLKFFKMRMITFSISMC